MRGNDAIVSALGRAGYRFMFGRDMMYIVTPMGNTMAVRLRKDEAEATRRRK